MSGVCPKCIKYHSDENLCPNCGSSLLSAQQWKEQRDTILEPGPPLETSVSTGVSSKPKVEMTAEKKDYVLGFFLGSLLFFFALLSAYIFFWGSFQQ